MDSRLESVVEYRPKPGVRSGFHASPLTLLRLRQLPQIVMLEGISLELLPVEAECIEVCSRSNGYCVRSGSGSCLSTFTPIIPGAPPAWVGFIGAFESIDASQPIMEASLQVTREEVSISGVYRPRLYHLEPLSIRVLRPESIEYVAQVVCLEWPGGAKVLVGKEPFTLIIEPGRVRSDREVYTVDARRCSRGLIARAVNTVFYGGLRGPMTLRGDVMLLDYVFHGNSLEVVLWNPHLHPVYAELYSSRYVVRKGVVYAPEGSEELREAYNRVALTLKAETVVRLQLSLRTLPPLLKPR